MDKASATVTDKHTTDKENQSNNCASLNSASTAKNKYHTENVANKKNELKRGSVTDPSSANFPFTGGAGPF